MAQPRLPVSFYEIHYVAVDDGQLGEDPRGLWHGVFGLGLRTVSCVMDGIKCEECPLLYHCAYSQIFTGPRPPDSELMRRYDTIPVPHIFHIPPEHPTTLRRGQSFPVGIVLVGNANDHLPVVIQALTEAGSRGLGADRVRLRLNRVLQHSPGRAKPLVAVARGQLVNRTAAAVPPTPPLPRFVRLEFLSPYKPSSRNFDIGHILMAIVRRISLLQYFYTGERLDAPFDELKAASQQVQVLNVDLRRQRSSRFASRQSRRVDTSGLIGHIDLAMDGIESLWPYLYLGQWLNVGKNASMGFGSFWVSESSAIENC